jgi:hypothetical protein
MWHSRKNWKLMALLIAACVGTCSVVAGAQTWSAPQFIANGFGIAVATNGSTSAVLFMPPSGGLQGLCKDRQHMEYAGDAERTGSIWQRHR